MRKSLSICFISKGSEYLLTIDYYSRFFEVDYMYLPNTKSQKRLQHMARMTIPEILVSDNVAQFSSTEFHDFANEWGFETQDFISYS